MSEFGRELTQSLSEALGILDGKLAPTSVGYRVTLRQVADLAGLSPSQMAARLGMDLGAYQKWEGTGLLLRGKALSPSPAELLQLLIESRATRGDI